MRSAPQPVLRRVCTGVIATALLGVAACSNSSSGSNSTDKAQATNASIASFNQAISSLPQNLSGFSTASATTMITSLVTQPLERQASDGTPKPNLATKVEQPDSKTLVYTIRPGVKFSDGSALTADDVAWSITRAADPSSTTSGNLFAVAGATATGALEVTVKLKSPLLTARYALAGIEIQQAAYGKAHLKDLGTASALPIGTGPYVYDEESSDAITLKPNPLYWGTKPKPQKITFSVVSTDNSAQLAMRSGSIQGAAITDTKTTQQWKSISGVSVYAAQNLSSDLLSMDTSKAPFNNIHLRKAIAYAVDREGVLEAAFGGYADLLQTVVPNGELTTVEPSEAEAKTFLDALPSYDLDLDKAKAELAQSPYASGLTVELPYTSTSSWMHLQALSLQENLKKIGVTLKLKAVSAQEWSSTIFSHQSTGLQLLGNFGTTLPDPAGVFAYLAGKANMKPNLPNIANFTTPTAESVLPTVAMTDGKSYTKAERWTATKTLMTEYAEQVPYVPLFSEQSVYALGTGLTYLSAPTMFSFIDGSWIEQLRATS